jgi:hypothetical protein
MAAVGIESAGRVGWLLALFEHFDGFIVLAHDAMELGEVGLHTVLLGLDAVETRVYVSLETVEPVAQIRETFVHL